MNNLNDLHSHLYGCLELEDLHWLASTNPIRWKIFTNSWSKHYKTQPDISNLFDNDPKKNNKLKDLYYPSLPGCFSSFQVSFDLVIALSSTSKQELIEITKRVLQREVSDYAEYKMMFSPFETKGNYQEKLIGLCEGMHAMQTQTKTSRLIMSIPREEKTGLEQYSWIKQTQAKNKIVKKYLVGIDFCGIEEGYPPLQQQKILKKIIADNKNSQEDALIITYHVGESFQDKSVESAIMWIIEAARLGCHRLGHALALGIPASFFQGTTRTESAEKRHELLDFKIKHIKELQSFGYSKTLNDLQAQIKNCKKSNHSINIHYNQQQTSDLACFQNWAMSIIKKTNIIIESCPTSNLFVGNLHTSDNHPLKRFLDAGLNVIIGSDDPGIFQTNIQKEFQKIKSWKGIDKTDIETLIQNGIRFTAENMLNKIQ